MRVKRFKKSEKRDRVRPAVSTEGQRKVYSYYAAGSGADSPERSDLAGSTSRGPWRVIRILPGIIAAVVIAGSILYSFTLSTQPTVSVVQQQPSLYRDEAEYAAAADEALRQNVRNRTKFTVQTHEVEEMLLQKYPELRDVVLRLPVMGRKPTLVIDIRQPVLLLTAASKTYVLDGNGIAVSEARTLPASDKNGLPVVQDQSGIDITLGKQVLTTETVRFITDALYQLSSKGYQVESLRLPVSINELDIQLRGLSFYIKTDSSLDARLQIGSFIAVWESLKEQGSAPAEYIDVRVEEKVFYR